MNSPTDAEPSMPSSKNEPINLDMQEIALLATVALEKDAPLTPLDYLNMIRNRAWPHITLDERKDINQQIEDKKYLGPAPKIEIAK